MKVRIVVLNYNGEELLKKYLPSLEEACRRSRYPCALTVLDNKSADGSLRVLSEKFPAVHVLASAQNRVLCSYNEAAAQLEDDILIFMNNDIRADAFFVDALVEPFLADPKVFFVTPKCLSLVDGSYEGSRTRGYLKYGFYWSSAIFPGYESGIEKPGPTLQGGFGAFDRKKFLELEGYDDLYLPGRLEDADLCFRAYKKGWKCLYAPRSVVYHEGGVSFHKRFGKRKTLVINARNTFLFMWKNLSDGRYLAQIIFWLPFRLAYSLVSLKTEIFQGFFLALPSLGKVLARRTRLSKDRTSGGPSDRDIFQLV